MSQTLRQSLPVSVAVNPKYKFLDPSKVKQQVEAGNTKIGYNNIPIPGNVQNGNTLSLSVNPVAGDFNMPSVRYEDTVRVSTTEG